MDENALPRAGRVKGPRVFLDYDQAELDAAYDQSQYAPNAAQVLKRLATNSALTRARLGEPSRMAYGAESIETLDFYSVHAPTAPTFIFIHGGAWRSGKARDYAVFADMFVGLGVNFIGLDFSAAQDVGGNLMTIADQVRRGVAWVYLKAGQLGIDRDRLYLGGHSSGGHLTSVCLVTEWETAFGVPADIVKGGLCSSGMYDLHAVRLSARSAYIRFDDRMEEALSAQRHLDKLRAPLIIAYGTCETPEFQRQARDFTAAVRDAGKPVRLIVGEHYNHFEMAETLANPFGLLGRAVLEQMGIGMVPTSR